jgi:hypothetical protein
MPNRSAPATGGRSFIKDKEKEKSPGRKMLKEVFAGLRIFFKRRNDFP